MDSLSSLIGFLAAHAVYCLREGGPLVPLLVTEDEEGERRFSRIARANLVEAIGLGRRFLEENPREAQRSALAWGGTVSSDGEVLTALLLEGVDHATGDELHMAVPYRDAKDPLGFAVHRPRFVEDGQFAVEDQIRLGQAFFLGVDGHRKGAEIWDKYAEQEA